MKTTNNFVLFWSGIYSQWYKCNFEIDGVTYTSAEQYMMYKKAMLFGDTRAADNIMATDSPKEQKGFGRAVNNFNKEQWEDVCKDYVYDANMAKFTQNIDLFAKLIATGNKELVEASPYDKIWGIGLHFDDELAEDKANWLGTNWLGEAITKVREDLKLKNGI